MWLVWLYLCLKGTDLKCEWTPVPRPTFKSEAGCTEYIKKMEPRVNVVDAKCLKSDDPEAK